MFQREWMRPTTRDSVRSVPRRIDRAITRALSDSRLDPAEATELIKQLKEDDVLTGVERTLLQDLLARHGDRFEPEARRMVSSFLDGGTPLTRGVVADPHLSWDTRDPLELRTPRGASLYVDGVNFDDVVQNELGDCFLLASLSALAAVRPQAIEDAIVDHGDGTFTVRFYEKQRSGPPTAVEIRVDSDLPARRNGELAYGQGRDRAELWPALVEKAFATWKGGYSELSLGGIAGDALTALTGTEAEFYNPIQELESKDLWKLLQDAQQAGRPMVSGTGVTSEEGLVPMHMYSVVSVREENGEKLITLRNPYGHQEPGADGKDDGVFELTLRQYRRHFEDLYLLQEG
jgi:hypothetical protein